MHMQIKNKRICVKNVAVGISAEIVEKGFPKKTWEVRLFPSENVEFSSVLSKIKFRRRLACSDSVLLGHKTVVVQLLYVQLSIHGSV